MTVYTETICLFTADYHLVNRSIAVKDIAVKN